jgi:dihydroorotate dehydrogenase electron transfer subunit
MRIDVVEVVEGRQVTADLWEMVLAAPELAASARAGQFVTLKVSDTTDPFLWRPMGLARMGGGTVSLLVRDAGRGSRMLIAMQPGEKLRCLGPLGNGFTIPAGARKLLLVAGGSGIAPMMALAEAAVRQGCTAVLVYGARTADLVFPRSRLPEGLSEYLVTTDDGTAGRHGRVTDLLDEYVPWADAVFACGPHAMFAAMQRHPALAGDVPVFMSLEEHMACGVGACVGCSVVMADGTTRSACHDGPVFDMRGLAWN